MYRIYCDLNVLLRINNPSNKYYPIFKNLIESNKDITILPYSNAHIRDLTKSKIDSSDQTYIEKDLNIINKYCNSQYISVNEFGTGLNLFDVNPFKAFEENNNSEISDIFDFDTLFDSDSEFTKLFKKRLLNIPHDIKFENYTNADDKKFFDKYFKRSVTNNNLYDFSQDWSYFQKELDENPELYNSIREINRKRYEIDTYVISGQTNPLVFLNKKLVDTDFSRSFNELISDDFLKSLGSDFYKSYFFKFILSYIYLDSFGYSVDKFDKRNLYRNFFNDALHTFYGAHCNYFISNEKKLIRKAKVLYEEFKSESYACSIEEFIDDFESKVSELSVNEFVRQIRQPLDPFAFSEFENKEDDRKSYIYKPQKAIVNYFNFQYLFLGTNHRTTMVLRRVNKNFSREAFYTEIIKSVDIIISVLGKDYKGRTGIKDDELKLFGEGKWEGRMWSTKDFFFILNKDSSFLNLQLTIEFVNQAFIQEVQRNQEI